MVEDIADVVSMICKKSSPEMTKDWFLDDIDIVPFMEFAKFIFEPMTARLKEVGSKGSGAEAKNLPSQISSPN